jgi:hypothetical protein
MTILIAMLPGGYGEMPIAQWNASVASCKATRCCHQASACTVSPWTSKRKKNTNKTQLLPTFFTVDECKKAIKS